VSACENRANESKKRMGERFVWRWETERVSEDGAWETSRVSDCGVGGSLKKCKRAGLDNYIVALFLFFVFVRSFVHSRDNIARWGFFRLLVVPDPIELVAIMVLTA